MFVIEVTYTKPLEIVNEYLDEHRRFLKEQLDAGTVVMTGRQEPPVGGIILAKGASRQEIEKLIEEDPFKKANVADYRVIEFTPKLYPEAFGAAIEQ